MSNILYKIGKYLAKRYCPHKTTVEIFDYPPDRYVQLMCTECHKNIFKSYD